MASLIALIILIVLIARSRRSHAWPLAMLMGVKHSLQAMLAIAGLLLMLVVGIGTIRAILHPVAEAAIALFPEGHPATSQARRVPALSPTAIPEVAIVPPPTPTPHAAVALDPQSYAMVMPTSIPGGTAVLLRRTPTPTPTATPTPIAATPASAPLRAGCDPAYPDARTCVPPGPPFEQGCAITDERRFTVLPPDPQGLDHDNDGIGCEPEA